MTRAKGFRGFLQWFFLPDVETLLNLGEETDQRLDLVGKNVSVLDKSVGTLDQSLAVLDKSVSSLDAGIALLVDQGLARLNEGMRRLDENMARIQTGMKQLNLGMDQLNKDTDEREKDLTERLAHLKAKLVDDHARAMGEIASLLDEHAFVEREQALREEELRAARARSRATVAAEPMDTILQAEGALAARLEDPRGTRAAEGHDSGDAEGEAFQVRLRNQPTAPSLDREAIEPRPQPARPAQPEAPSGARESDRAAFAERQPAARTPGNTLGEDEEPAARPRGLTRLQAVPPPPAQRTPSDIEQREDEQKSRAAALADPVATMNRLSAILGLSRAPDQYGPASQAGAGNAALDFAAILEGIKRSSARGQNPAAQLERRAL